MAEPRDRLFAPTALLGPTVAGLAALAAAQEWATAGEAGVATATGEGPSRVEGTEASPLALALSLVALAAWGALLVTRGRVRRGMALAGLVAAVGALVAVAAGFATAQDLVAEAARGEVAGGGGPGGDVGTSLTGWYWASGAGALLTAASHALAVARAPRWPAMGDRYDAPTGSARHGDGGPDPERDPWRVLDHGGDPTA